MATEETHETTVTSEGSFDAFINPTGNHGKEKSLNKPTPFDGDRKKVITFIQECRMYLQTNRHIYNSSDDQVAYFLSFMTQKEALKWKQTYLRGITDEEGEMHYPPIKDFVNLLENYFKPANQVRDAAHQLKILRQGKRSAEEVITDFRLLVAEAGYTTDTPADSLHLIDKLQDVLNPALVKKILACEKIPTTIEDWALKAIDIDSNYRSSLDILSRYAVRTVSRNTTTSSGYRRREERDPDAMDVDAMSTEERDTLMRKGACFICKKPGHRARDCDEKKTNSKKPTSSFNNSTSSNTNNSYKPRNIKRIHAVLQGLTKEEKDELIALQKEDMKEDNDEDF
jgi:hypothetical protein